MGAVLRGHGRPGQKDWLEIRQGVRIIVGAFASGLLHPQPDGASASGSQFVKRMLKRAVKSRMERHPILRNNNKIGRKSKNWPGCEAVLTQHPAFFDTRLPKNARFVPLTLIGRFYIITEWREAALVPCAFSHVVKWFILRYAATPHPLCRSKRNGSYRRS